jgi:hypothetical protein
MRRRSPDIIAFTLIGLMGVWGLLVALILCNPANY